MNLLWGLFIGLQVMSAGNINYQQEHGYYEINPIYHIYGDRHPSKEQVYLTKVIETGGVFVATKIFPEYKEAIVKGASTICVSFMVYDGVTGIGIKVRY